MLQQTWPAATSASEHVAGGLCSNREHVEDTGASRAAERGNGPAMQPSVCVSPPASRDHGRTPIGRASTGLPSPIGVHLYNGKVTLPKPRRRRREDVTETALHLLDAYGLPDLTMRHVAGALGMQPSALYWHFPNKQALLAAVSARILAPMAEAPIEDLTPYDAVCVLGERLRNCLLTYKDAAELVSSSLALGLVDSPVRPQLIAMAKRHDIPGSLSHVTAEVLVHFAVGYVFHEQQRQNADSLGLLESPSGLRPDWPNSDVARGDDFAKAVRMIADGLDVSATRSALQHG